MQIADWLCRCLEASVESLCFLCQGCIAFISVESVTGFRQKKRRESLKEKENKKRSVMVRIQELEKRERGRESRRGEGKEKKN